MMVFLKTFVALIILSQVNSFARAEEDPPLSHLDSRQVWFSVERGALVVNIEGKSVVIRDTPVTALDRDFLMKVKNRLDDDLDQLKQDCDGVAYVTITPESWRSFPFFRGLYARVDSLKVDLDECAYVEWLEE